MARVRADRELVAQGFFATQDEAMRSIMAGDVSLSDRRVQSPGEQVKPGCAFHVRGTKQYVSRGGLKLEGALDEFGVDPTGKTCLDVGCSTGGFTDCLLSRGAASVVAVDVGYAQFSWQLRQDKRVELLERTNIVDVATPERQGSIELAVCDVSFTSVAVIVDAVARMLCPTGTFITLIKPQFEAERKQVGEKGIVRDPAVWAQSIHKVAQACAQAGLAPQKLCVSPIAGHKGNREFLLLTQKDAEVQDLPVDEIIASV